MRILAVSDVHLRQGLGYGRTPDVRLDDQEQVLAQAAALAIEERVDVVLFGGDMFEGPGVPSSDYLRVRRAFCAPLAAAGIPVVAVSGNSRHDSAGNQGEDNALAVLHDPGRFDVHTRAALHVLPGLVVACVPWASTARLRAMLNGAAADDADAMAAELVIRICADLRARALREHPDVPCVLLSHFATTGWKTPTGLPTDEIRDVVLPLHEIEALGFDAALLGHIHCPGVINGLSERGSGRKAEALSPLPERIVEGAPTGPRSLSPIVSLGSPLCLNFGEEHVDHGCWLIEDGAASFVRLTSRPFVTLDLWAAGLDVPREPDPEERALLADAIVRVRYAATPEQARRVDQSALTATLLDAGAHSVRFDVKPISESRARVTGVTADLTPLDAVQLYAEARGLDEAAAGRLAAWTTETLGAVA